MRRLLLLLAILLPMGVGWGQSLLWQQRYSWSDSDALTDIVSLGDSTFLAVGYARYSPEMAVTRLTLSGDTLYARALPIWRYYNQKYNLCRLSTGEVYAAAISSFLGTQERTRLVRIRPEDGSAYWMLDLPVVGRGSPFFAVNSFTEGPNNTLVLAGSASDPLGQAVNVGYLACYDTLGTLQWDTIIREHPTNTFCHHVEMTRDGNILVSGTAGSRIFAAEYAQDGYEIRRATFYQSLGRINFDYNPTVSVRQAPGDRYLVSGTILTSPMTTNYIGLHQGWAGPKLWGGEQVTTGSLPAQVNADGSITVFQGRSQLPWLVRLRADSMEMWRSSPLLYQNQRAIMSACASLSDSSAVCTGYIRPQTSGAEDWYAARITNMGLPYRPWQPATAAKAQASQPAPRPYPNPCSGSLHFAGLTSPGTLQLFGTDGRLHLSQALAPGQAVDVSALVPGVYGYQLTVQGKSWRGRIVKS